MENVNIVLAANILKYRKKSGLSQEELANKLGVTFQAVSKWENAKAAPDITFLPIMADIFGCYIDELFSREVKTEIHYDHCAELPWYDDNTIRIFQTLGKKILESTDAGSLIAVDFPRDCNETNRQYFKVEIFGNVACHDINGDVICHGDINCYEINGGIKSQGDINAHQINSYGEISCNMLIKGEH